MIATIIDFIAWLFEKPEPEAKRTPDIVPYRDADGVYHSNCPGFCCADPELWK
jgi:hypothetical protein